jgi:hypothetical protein
MASLDAHVKNYLSGPQRGSAGIGTKVLQISHLNRSLPDTPSPNAAAAWTLNRYRNFGAQSRPLSRRARTTVRIQTGHIQEDARTRLSAGEAGAVIWATRSGGSVLDCASNGPTVDATTRRPFWSKGFWDSMLQPIQQTWPRGDRPQFAGRRCGDPQRCDARHDDRLHPSPSSRAYRLSQSLDTHQKRH